MLDPNHEGKREALRSLGMVLVIAGGILTAIGMIDFFSAMGTFGPPRYFWCAFLGLPLLGFGGNLLRYGYMGAATRYVAGEVAPVAKDAINYIGEQTKDTIVDIARSVVAGVGGGTGSEVRKLIPCPQCGAENPPDAQFCSACGTSFSKGIRCPSCGEDNAPGAKFCHHCGRALT